MWVKQCTHNRVKTVNVLHLKSNALQQLKSTMHILAPEADMEHKSEMLEKQKP